MAPVTIDHHGSPLLVFETSEDYHRHNAIEGYWGPVASSIDWCERNYVVSFYVAEWFNCLSNVGMIALGIFGVAMARESHLEARVQLQYAGTALVGLGSAAFHGTLTHIGQQGDETPMVIALSLWLWLLYFLDPAYEVRFKAFSLRMAVAAIAFCLVFACAHYVYRFTIAFQLMILSGIVAGLVLLSKEWRRCSDAAALRVGKRCYVACGLTAFALWLCDQHFCVHLHNLPGRLHNPQFHAWWHLLMGVQMHCGTFFASYQRCTMLGQHPSIRYSLGLLPYVHIASQQKRSSQLAR
jgi:dihydroceramidase